MRPLDMETALKSLITLKAYYPNQRESIDDVTIRAYAKDLLGIDADAFQEALREIVRERKTFPTIAHIRETVGIVLATRERSEMNLPNFRPISETERQECLKLIRRVAGALQSGTYPNYARGSSQSDANPPQGVLGAPDGFERGTDEPR